jgi:hypothetical protein
LGPGQSGWERIASDTAAWLESKVG